MLKWARLFKRHFLNVRGSQKEKKKNIFGGLMSNTRRVHFRKKFSRLRAVFTLAFYFGIKERRNPSFFFLLLVGVQTK
jgi:hypothetical protein